MAPSSSMLLSPSVDKREHWSGLLSHDSPALCTMCAGRQGSPDDGAPEPCGAGPQVGVQGPDDADRQPVRAGAQAAASPHQHIDGAASQQCVVSVESARTSRMLVMCQAHQCWHRTWLARPPAWLLSGPASRRAPANKRRNRDWRKSKRRRPRAPAQLLRQQRGQHVQAPVGEVDGRAARGGLAVQLRLLPHVQRPLTLQQRCNMLIAWAHLCEPLARGWASAR